MANFIIENQTTSMLDLSAIKDVDNNPVVLRPRDKPGCKREISSEAAHHEAVQRVLSAQWVVLSTATINVAPPVVEAAPVVVETVDIDAPPPVTENVIESASESAPESVEGVPAAETSVEEVVASAPVADDVQPVVEEVGPAAQVTETVSKEPEATAPSRTGRRDRR